jgi:hypothetical protein
MNQAQKAYLNRKILRSVRRCRRCISAKSWRTLEIEQGVLEALWCLRQQMRRLEVGR